MKKKNDSEIETETEAKTDSTPVEPLYRSRLERQMKTSVQLLPVTLASWRAWSLPFGDKVGPQDEDGFQRPFMMNKYVVEVAQSISDTGVVPGQIVVGIYLGTLWLIDGQHRAKAFELATLGEYGVKPITSAVINVKFEEFDSWEGMSLRFAELQRKIRGNRPNDMLKALEFSSPSLRLLRKRFPEIGYGSTRAMGRNKRGSLSAVIVLGAWYSSKVELPNRVQLTPFDIAKNFTEDDACHLARFLRCASTWTFHGNVLTLWSQLNLTLCLWLYRRCVLTPTDGFPVMTDTEFTSCLRTLDSLTIGGSTTYPEWLYNKKTLQRDRGPVYHHLTRAFQGVLRSLHGRRTQKFPLPQWVFANP